MKCDIAILTFHRACNYGAFLQTFALQEVLNENNDVNVFVFDYIAEEIEKRYSPFYWMTKKTDLLIRFSKTLLEFGGIIRRNRKFLQARNQYFHYKDKAVSYLEVKEKSEHYDCFIVGSDQVWNMDLTGEEKTFFLDFVTGSVLKYSYAASIGKNSLTEEEKQRIIGLIKSFDGISVREKDLIPLFIDEIPDIIQCVDPVFLYTADKWRSFSKAVNSDPYVLFFITGQGGQLMQDYQFALQYSKEHNLRIVFLSDNCDWYHFREADHFGSASPEEFVGLIDNAECVITNSFHATAFSIILHTVFFVEATSKRSSRITNLLSTVNLEDRILTNGKRSSYQKPIEWEKVDRDLLKSCDISRNYLSRIINKLEYNLHVNC